MHGESRLGRALWIGLLVVLVAYVAADFARSPFVAPNGSAAVRPPKLTLWTPAGESGGETGAVLQQTAAALELAGHSTAVKTLPGGSSEAIGDFFSQTPSDQGTDLLVVTSTTVADLAHDRRDRLVPGAAEAAALARAMLRPVQPIGVLETDPLTLAVSRYSPIAGTDSLLAAMRSDPGSRLFGIADDTWSRVQLAALLERAGVNGHVRFSVFQSGAEAGQALETGAANTVLATRGALAEDLSEGSLRELEWPMGRSEAPRAWVAVVARPDLPAERVARLRRWFAALANDRRWRVLLRSAGRHPGGDRRQLAELLRNPAPADRLERLAQLVARR
jgi:tripartite-type tricarboxylate transporter receptor subunit TctC